MVHTPNTKPFLKKILPLIREMNKLEKQKEDFQISILEQEISKEEITNMVKEGIYKEPYTTNNYFCNENYFNKINRSPCPLTEKCEYITKEMGNDCMPCEVLYIKLVKENEL